MLIPVYNVIDFTGNRYLLAKAAMKRARQVNFVGDESLESFRGKIVSLALKQVLDNDVKYTLSKEEVPAEQVERES
jgi:DNA-directed RNA polymerase subunit K/omega